MKYENEYNDLLNKALYEDAFLLLEKNTNLIDSKIEQKKHIREFLNFINDKFDSILDDDNMVTFASDFVTAFKELPFLADSAKKMNNIFETEKISLMFSKLVGNNDYQSAKFLLPYFHKNIELFPKTLETIIEEKNVDSLRFLCENLDNIHYGNGHILRASSKLPAPVIISLINDFDFDINETDVDVRSSLMSEVITEKNIRTFKALVDKFGSTINWGQVFSTKLGTTFFDLIDQTKIPLEFYSILLEEEDLSQNYVDRIGQSLFESNDILKKASNTNIYDKFFSHPNFEHSSFNLGQVYCLYGLLARLGVNTVEESNGLVAKAYVKIIDSFLNSRNDDDMPSATNFHIVGAAIYVAKESKSQEAINACNLVLRRYKHYINKPNPDGILPISQVEESHALYRVLINNGAITPKPPPGFWTSVATSIGLMKKVNLKEEIIKQQKEEENLLRSSKSSLTVSSLAVVKLEMRNNFREMRQTLSNHLCDPMIKLKCENIFLQSENILTKMEKYKLTNSTEDIYFLGQTFSSYLTKSLKSYMNVCEATVDFGRDNTVDIKLEKAKKDCLEGINLIEKQLDLIINNVSSEVEKSALSDARVNRKFLENKFTGNEVLTSIEKNLKNIRESSISSGESLNSTGDIIKYRDENLDNSDKKDVESLSNESELSVKNYLDDIVGPRNYHEIKQSKRFKA